MTSLTRIAIAARKTIRIGVFLVIFLIVARILFGIGIGIYRRYFPEAPPAPTVSFGKLPKLPFPEDTFPNLSFTVETSEGGLPKLSTQTKVYIMPKPAPSLLSLDQARDKARALGFKEEGAQEVSETLYRFPHNVAHSTLEMNIVTGIFSISFDLASDSSPLERRPPAPELAASQVRSYLSPANLLPDDLTGGVTSEFLKVEGGELVSAVSLSEADLVRVDFFRKSFEDLPSLTTNPSQANVWFIVSGSPTRDKQFIAGEYHYFPVDEGQSGTYPLKTSEEGWGELTSGGAFVANLGGYKDGDNVKIRKVYLAYYDAGVSTDFFQPIIVFDEGVEGGFVAYVPAVTSDYYGE